MGREFIVLILNRVLIEREGPHYLESQRGGTVSVIYTGY